MFISDGVLHHGIGSTVYGRECLAWKDRLQTNSFHHLNHRLVFKIHCRGHSFPGTPAGLFTCPRPPTNLSPEKWTEVSHEDESSNLHQPGPTADKAATPSLWLPACVTSRKHILKVAGYAKTWDVTGLGVTKGWGTGQAVLSDRLIQVENLHVCSLNSLLLPLVVVPYLGIQFFQSLYMAQTLKIIHASISNSPHPPTLASFFTSRYQTSDTRP